MRNKINVIVCIMIVACVAIFAVACAPKDADGLIKLASPSNLALNGSVLSWDEVENAKEYFISVDGVEKEQSVTTTTCDLSAMVTGYGNFSIAVRAYGDGKKYGTSDKSAAIVYHKGNALDTPVVTIVDKVASWNAVDKAVDYSVRVTNEKGVLLDEVKSEALSYNFADKKSDSEDEKELYGEYGAYRISVTANPASDNIEYTSSLPGAATYYNSTVLSVPKFTDMTGTTIRWGAVSNATNYTLRKTYEDDTYEDAVVTGTSYAYRTKFNLEKVGKYTFTIRANGDNQVYYTSDFSEKDNEYVINKLASVDAKDMSLTYDQNGKAKLKWKISADSLATEFALNLSALLPDGSVKLESSILHQTISNKIVFVEADVYDFYKYDTDGVGLIKEEKTILVYNMNGYAKIRYDGNDYFLKDKDGKDVLWKNYAPGASVDIICDMSDPNAIKFVNERKEYTNPEDGAILSQNTGESENVLGTDGKQLFYFEEVDGESKINVIKGLEYDVDKVTYHTFELMLDDIFIKENDGEGEDPYEYLISDNSYYGLIYDVSISADNTSKNFVVSQSVSTEGQYMSYKIPQKENGKFVVTNTGEYAYIILNSFINPGNTDEFSIEDNINFNGYEIAQIETFGGVIDGNKHTVSGIVVGNKVMTQNGVIKNDGSSDLEYSMFVNIDGKGNSSKGIIQNIFYVGMSFVGYDKEKLDDSVTSIKVAPIAINNKGAIRNALVQSDSIKAEGAQVAGMVINNYGYINSASVYAELEGMNVGGVMINNAGENAFVAFVGFYGKVTATLSDFLTEGVTSIGGAGFAVNNDSAIANSFAIGDVSVTAAGLDSVYAGGFVAVNNGNIGQSYSGEFTLNNPDVNTVVSNGDNAYAGGFVGLNTGDIRSSYATNKATASMYSGGFVGLNNATVLSCYSTGGTTRTGENKGSFVGKNDGNIDKSVCYSTDSWAEDGAVEVLKSSEKLGDIINILYGEDEAVMVLLREQGYRNPLIQGLIYMVRNSNDTSEDRNIVTMRPSQTVDTQGVVFNREVIDVESILHGDNTKKGNRIVIELSCDNIPSRYVYGYVN